MNETTTAIWVKPARAGLSVRDPKTGKQLPEDGAEVQADSYWLRRIHDGDVTQSEAKPKKAAPAAKKAGDK